jgi:3-phosphoshikimate 1-carboxyvinyltransferase
MNKREVIPLKQGLDFNLTLPGSKSITNRAFLCAALAKEKSRLYGALESDDTKVMMKALKKIGIKIKEKGDLIEVQGCDGKFNPGNITVNAGASGTTTRFLTALAVLRKGKTNIEGTKRMKKRPIQDLKDALDQLNKDKKTIRIKGNKSSQFLSALLMISPFFGPLTIEVTGELVSKPYIDITLAVMKAFGVKVQNNNYKSFIVKTQKYKATDYHIEGDASAASYWVAMVDLHGGKIDFNNLNLKRSIQGDAKFINVLSQMSEIRGQRLLDMNPMPDVAMTAAVLAPFAKGQTKITGLSTLRLKETDRLAALENELKKVGVKVRTTKDSITVVGPACGRGADGGANRCKPEIKPQWPHAKRPNNGPTIGTYDDHRMAMCFAVLGSMVPGIVIEDPGCVNKTYPQFWNDLEKAYLAPVMLGQKNLVLTGLRCAGKTRLGKKIAKLLNREFVDLDLEIEKGMNMTISEIVKKHGWPYFRKLEAVAAKALSIKTSDPLVIATGGGVVLNKESMKALKKNGVNVFIFTDTDVLIERIRKKAGTRPTITGKGSVKEMREVWKERRDLYLEYADFVWDNTSGKVIEKNLDQLFM